MPFAFKKVSNHGTRHPIVARLKMQTLEFVQWTNLPKDKRETVVGVYFDLAERLLKCHEVYERLLAARKTAIAEVRPTGDLRVRSVPYVIGLRGEVETLLYESKNFLRELLRVVNIFFGTEFREASAFFGAARKGNGDLVEWATRKFGAQDNFTRMLVCDQDWVGELIRRRNAVEHPGGNSGTLSIENFKATEDGRLVPPSWRRGAEPTTDVFQDLETYLDNLLTLAEEILVSCVFQMTEHKVIQFVEIPEKGRNPDCPVRLTIQAKIELLPFAPK